MKSRDVAALINPFIDLVDVPYTAPLTRFIVRREGDDLALYEVRYEVPLESCRVATITGGEVNATVLGLEFAAAQLEVIEEGCVITGKTPPSITICDPDFAALELNEETLLICRKPAGAPITAALCDMRLVEARAYLHSWLTATPKVRDEWQAMVALCWWVLGNNTLRLSGKVGSRAIVPSKLGYVGLWQWDTYFIALALQHGAPGLAREIMDLALAYPTPEGQLPDVVHEAGVLASSADLPASDQETLLAHGSPAPGLGTVPLTKPPLTAWVVQKLAANGAITPAQVAEWLPTISASQDWWFTYSDPHNTGYPAYLHPYSSGLDDSPIFDATLPVSTPDLAAYLISQDQILAELHEQYGDQAAAKRHTARAEVTLARLIETWDETAQLFTPPPRTIVHLMPLLTGKLPTEITEALLADMHDPQRFAATHRLPTVAKDEESFQPRRMWRGPVWVNTNYLVADGLRRSGFDAEAKALEHETIELILTAGGPYEYIEAATGKPGDRSTSCFGWSAALFIDLAVRHSAAD